MAAPDSRLAVTPTCEAHSYLLKAWAQLTGRSVSGLAASLLEGAITQALRNGDVPTVAVEAMNAYIEARGECMAEDHQAFIKQIKVMG